MTEATKTNLFGFSTEPSSGGDFTPIIKYDARSGRMHRIDRVQDANGFSSEPVDITQSFKAVADFENIETGWIRFAADSPPSFALVKVGQQRPAKPSDQHKDGIRLMLRLSAACGGDKPVREIAGVAKSFLAGFEQAYAEYLREKDKYPGQLPVLSLASTTPVTTGSGATKSTNYRPNFRIDGWKPRPNDLVHIAAPAAATTATNGSGIAPATGGQTVPPPNTFKPAPVLQANTNLDDDFG
jgi:hypothetical protein